MTGCADCKALLLEIERIEAENARLLRALHREAEQWDTRAPHTAKLPHERYGHGPHITSN